MTKKVLIVEDSHLLRKIIREALMDAGYIVYEAENGRSGLMSIKETKPDVVLLDVLMPVMDGQTMYDELRAQAWGKATPVIMLTSSANTELSNWMEERALDAIKKDDTMVAEVIKKIDQLFDTTGASPG